MGVAYGSPLLSIRDKKQLVKVNIVFAKPIDNYEKDTKMSKRAIQLTALTMGLLTMTSCASYVDHQITVNNSNSVDYDATYGFPSESIDQESVGGLLDSAAEEISEKGVEFKSKDYNEQGVIGRTFSFSNINAEQLHTVNKDASLSETSNGQVLLDLSGVTHGNEEFYRISVTMPGKIILAEGATIDGKTATWDVTEHSGDLKVLSEKGNSITEIALISGGILLVLGGLLTFVFHRRGNGLKK